MISYQTRDLRTAWTFRASGKGPQPPREYVGEFCHKAWGREEPCPSCPAQEAMEASRPTEAQVISPDNHQWLVRCYPVTDENGEVSGAIKVAHPVRQFTPPQEDTPSAEAAEVLDALGDHVALLDERGQIVSVNEAWLEFARENDGSRVESLAAGADYLSACRESARQESPLAAEALAGIEAVLAGRREQFELVYPCHSPTQQRWFLMRVHRLAHKPGAVVSHANITDLYEVRGHPGRGELLSLAQQRVAALTEQVDSLRLLAGQHEQRLRQADEQQQDASLRLREVHHRIKNSLSMVAGLIGLHADHAVDPRVQAALEDVRLRIQAVAAVHSMTQQGDLRGPVDIPSYVDQLVRQLRSAYHWPKGKVEITLDADPLLVPAEQAVPIGLIVHELIVNAMKHAFPAGRAGRVDVRLLLDENRRLIVEVADDGIGVGAGFDPAGTETMGLQLVGILAKQLGSSLQVFSDHGSSFRLVLPNVEVLGDT